jgi:hypothetical protein
MMARVKAAKLAKGKAKTGELTPNVMMIRGTKAWRDWLKEFAEVVGTTPTAAIEHALRLAATHYSFKAPPKRLN